MGALIIHLSVVIRARPILYFLAWTQSDFGDFLNDDTREKRNKKEGGEKKDMKSFFLSENDYIAAVTINGGQKEEERGVGSSVCTLRIEWLASQ